MAGLMSKLPPINFEKLRFDISSQKVRVAVAVGVGFGVALGIGFLVKYLRKKKPISGKTVANGSLQRTSSQKSSVNQASSSIVDRPSSISKRKKNSSSTASYGTVQNETNFGPRPTVSIKQDVLVYQGLENLTEAIRYFERAVNGGDGPILAENVSADKELLEALEKVLDKSYQLQDDLNILLKKYCPDAGDSFSIASGGYATPMYSDIGIHPSRRTLSVLSDDSYASALDDLLPSIVELELPSREPLNFSADELVFFQDGLREVNNLNVPCRVMRTEFLKCKSDDEFLAKLYCVRLAFGKLLLDNEKRDWLAFVGRSLLTDLLVKANKDASGFQKVYDEMMLFVQEEDNWTKILEELRGRKLVEFSFYDVVLDFIFMDAFDDLAHPPASVIAVAQNRFLSSSFKESTLSAVVWSVIKAKRTRLMYSDGFIAHFYNISEQVSPIMAWGFLGTDETLKDLFNYFKSQLCNFLIDIFNFERVRYTNIDDMAVDIWDIFQTRAKITEENFNEEEDKDYSPN